MKVPIEALDTFVERSDFANKVINKAVRMGFTVSGDKIEEEKESFNLINGGQVYRLESEERYHHQYGSGGEKASVATLIKVNGSREEILKSYYGTSWSTYSDDSEDYPLGEMRYVKLASEDGLARAVFEEIQKGLVVKRKPEIRAEGVTA